MKTSFAAALAGMSFVAAALSGARAPAAVTLRIPVGGDTLFVELNDPDAAVQVLSDKASVEIASRGERGKLVIVVDADHHTIRVAQNNTEVSGQEVSIKVEGKPLVRAVLAIAEKPVDKQVAVTNVIKFTAWDYPADENNVAGKFEQQADGTWSEFKNNQPFSQFKESARTAEYVELYDETRPVYVRLSASQMSWSRDRQEWHEMYQGAPRSEAKKLN